MAGVETLAAIALAGPGKLAYNVASDAVKAWIAGKQEKAAVSAEQIGALVSQYLESRDKYLESNPDPTASIERRRADLLKQISRCQNRILFEVSDPDLIARLVPFAIEQTTTLYGISKEAEFAIVEMGIGQLDSIIARNAANLQMRNSRRSLAISLTVGVVILIAALIAASSYFGVSSSTVVPLISIPLPIILWSVLGSLGAMLYRFNASADAELADPLRWSFTRPLTGILMGIIAYMVFKVGILVLQPTGIPVRLDMRCPGPRKSCFGSQPS